MHFSGAPIHGWYQRKIRKPFLSVLQQGTTPGRLSASISCGAVVGICPLIGASTFVSLLLGTLFRLNHPAIQLFNYLVYPLQILLVIPFIQLGAVLFRAEAAAITLGELEAIMKQGSLVTLDYLSGSILHALAAWAVVGIPLFLLLTASIVPVLRRLRR